LPVSAGFLAPPGPLLLAGSPGFAFPSPASISRWMASFSDEIRWPAPLRCRCLDPWTRAAYISRGQ
jgi:hypothetical protein